MWCLKCRRRICRKCGDAVTSVEVFRVVQVDVFEVGSCFECGCVDGCCAEVCNVHCWAVALLDGMFDVAVLNVEVCMDDVLWYAMPSAESCSPLRGVSLLDECMT